LPQLLPEDGKQLDSPPRGAGRNTIAQARLTATSEMALVRSAVAAALPGGDGWNELRPRSYRRMDLAIACLTGR